MNLRNLILAALAVIAALAAFLILRPSDERRIRGVFERVADQVARRPNEPLVISAAKARSLAGLCADPLRFSVPELGSVLTLEADRLTAVVNAVRTQEQEIEVRFADLDVTFTGPDEALVRARAEFNARPDNFGFPHGEDRAVEAVMVRRGSSWVFSGVTVSKPAP